MTSNDFLISATKQLTTAGIETARLDVLILMEDALEIGRAQLLAQPEIEVPKAIKKLLDAQVLQRAAHEPLAYLRGKTEFYGREFTISPAVLEPRPESEAMISLLMKLNEKPAPAIADVGTGSGALGITAKLELPKATVDLLDIDQDAIEIAKMNVIKLTTGISVIHTDLLVGSRQNYDILLCNLPYVPDEHTINQAAMHEPKIAIFGGPDGLNLYRKLFNQVENLKKKPLLILTESLPPQHEALKAIAVSSGYDQIEEDDFIQAFCPAGN